MDLATAKGQAKLLNAQYKMQPTAIQDQQIAKRNEVQQWLTWNGENAALLDYPTGTALSTGQTGNGASTNKAQFKGDYFHSPALVRITTTIGSTPTCTYAIEGSVDGSAGWTALYYADFSTPTTFVNTTFVLTTATTVIKIIKAGQNFRWLRVSYTLNTNVTNTVDVTILGD